MTKNPFINACAAAAYIVCVVLVIANGSWLFGPEETILIPMAMLSLFVLSAALMGYLFLAEPISMFLGGDRQGGTRLFLQTVGVFAGITLLFFIAMVVYGSLLPTPLIPGPEALP